MASPAGIAELLTNALPWVEPPALLALRPLFALRDVRKGQLLLAQGVVSQQVMLVERGALRLFFTRPDGREFNKNFFVEGSLVLPLTAAMSREPSLFGVAALERSAVWLAPLSRYRQALEDAGQWHLVQRKLLAGMVDHKLRREHDLLALTGRQRYDAFCIEYPALARRIPLGQLASYLGLTEVSLSRIRHTPPRRTPARPQRTR